MVTGGLACTVGAVGLVAVGFCKGRIGFGQRTIDLVGGDVQKPEAAFCRSPPLWAITLIGQGRPKASHRLQQAEGAHDVGLNELTGAMDGAVHMAFGGKVDHRAGLVLGQQAADQVGIADVALKQLVAYITLHHQKRYGRNFRKVDTFEVKNLCNGFLTCRKKNKAKCAY